MTLIKGLAESVYKPQVQGPFQYLTSLDVLMHPRLLTYASTTSLAYIDICSMHRPNQSRLSSRFFLFLFPLLL